MDASINCIKKFHFYEVESGLCEPCKTICYLAKEKGLLSLCENLCGDYFKTYGISALPGEPLKDDVDFTEHIADRLDSIERSVKAVLGILIVLEFVIITAFVAYCLRKCKKIKRRKPQSSIPIQATTHPTYSQSGHTKHASGSQSVDRPMIDGTENKDIHGDETSDSQSANDTNNTTPLIDETNDKDIHVDEPSEMNDTLKLGFYVKVPPI